MTRGVESAGTDLQSWCIWLQARHTNTFPVEWWEDNNKNVSILWDENCTYAYYAPLYLCSESHWFLCNIYGPSDNHKFLDFMLASICHLGDDQCVAMGDRQTHPISHTETHTQTHTTDSDMIFGTTGATSGCVNFLKTAWIFQQTTQITNRIFRKVRKKWSN